jgi:hypothetical protein
MEIDVSQVGVLPAVIVDAMAEGRRHAPHAGVEDRIVLFDVAALGARAHRIGALPQRGLVAFPPQFRQSAADLLVRSRQDEMADFQGVLRAAGDHALFLVKRLCGRPLLRRRSRRDGGEGEEDCERGKDDSPGAWQHDFSFRRDDRDHCP